MSSKQNTEAKMIEIQNKTLSTFKEFLSLASEAAREQKNWFQQTTRETSQTKNFEYPKRNQLQNTAIRCASLLEEKLSNPNTHFELCAMILNGISNTKSIYLAKIAVRATICNPSPSVRWYGLQTAFFVRATYFRQTFLDVLNDPSPKVREAAAQYLFGFKKSRYRNMVRDALLRIVLNIEEDITVRAAALQSVAYYQGHSVRKALLALRTEPNEKLRTQAEAIIAVRPYQLRRLRRRT